MTIEITAGFLFILSILFFYMMRQHSLCKKLKQQNDALKKRVDDEIEKNKQNELILFQQSRRAQMGEMIDMIAHQWRQPLTAISATSSALSLKAKLGNLDDLSVLELSDRITEYAKHLNATINDFRYFFKLNKKKKETTYNEIIKDVLDIVEVPIVNKNITIFKELNSKTVFKTYVNEMKQVVLNLIKNAEDTLIEREIKNPTIKIYTKDNILKISDNAGGLSEDILDKIFDPYFSTKKEGTGLGLYMSKVIVEDHCQGKLEVSNDENGAVFTITL